MRNRKDCYCNLNLEDGAHVSCQPTRYTPKLNVSFGFLKSIDMPGLVSLAISMAAYKQHCREISQSSWWQHMRCSVHLMAHNCQN